MSSPLVFVHGRQTRAVCRFIVRELLSHPDNDPTNISLILSKTTPELCCVVSEGPTINEAIRGISLQDIAQRHQQTRTCGRSH
jgi:hypothetical protein